MDISKIIQIIEATEGVSFPPEERVLQAYLHFEALTNHDYTYSCVSCGYSPAVVVMDVHKNGVFDVPGQLTGHSNVNIILTLLSYFVVFNLKSCAMNNQLFIYQCATSRALPRTTMVAWTLSLFGVLLPQK